MDHVGVVVDNLDAAIAFFVELGMELDGATTPVQGDWVDRVVGLDDVHVEIAFVRTPDGHGRLELTKFHNPTATTAEPNAPANTIGLRRIMFAVDDIDDVVARMQAHGAELVGAIAQYEDFYRLCYLRGPSGIIVALAQQLPMKRAQLHQQHRLAASGPRTMRHHRTATRDTRMPRGRQDAV